MLGCILGRRVAHLPLAPNGNVDRKVGHSHTATDISSVTDKCALLRGEEAAPNQSKARSPSDNQAEEGRMGYHLENTELGSYFAFSFCSLG
jgi:hypothetical protein